MSEPQDGLPVEARRVAEGLTAMSLDAPVGGARIAAKLGISRTHVSRLQAHPWTCFAASS